LPSSPEPIRIDRFIEKRFKVLLRYETLPYGILAFTSFGWNGVTAVVISRKLEAEGSKVAERRVRTTIGHEGGHRLLHAHLFSLREVALNLFGQDSQSGERILCRDIDDSEKKGMAMMGVGGRFRPTALWVACFARGLSWRARCDRFCPQSVCLVWMY
jgi:hypothetical protein